MTKAKGTGVLVDERNVRLQCSVCGQVWSPRIRSGGRLQRGSHRCPNGCEEGVVCPNCGVTLTSDNRGPPDVALCGPCYREFGPVGGSVVK